MNTVFLLMAEYGQATVPLETIAKKYLNISLAEANRNASKQSLPFPVFRAPSQRSPWMVNIADLAEWIDKQRDKAREDWKTIQGAAA